MKKITKVTLMILLLVIIGLGVMVWLSSKPMTYSEADQSIESLLEKEVKKNDRVTSALVYIDAPQYGIRESYAVGTEAGKQVEPSQAFHVASVGKSFTATLIGVLVDDGLISLDDKLMKYLDASLLSGLFEFEGSDYSSAVTIKQLLNHTSGVADYFEDPAIGSEDLIDLMINEPDTFYTPNDLLDFSRSYQVAVGKPGEVYHYSDTGYILLGLLIESVSHQSFDEMLHENIFEPLEMNDSYLMFYSEPVNEIREIADVWLKGTEISHYQSLSIDWSGGGIISTLEDLSVFVRALNHGEIISESTLADLYTFDQKFMKGIHYGGGFMEYHFEEFFPTLKYMPNLRGHMGVLGTQMLYDKKTDTTYICSFGSIDYAAGSVETMIRILGTASRIKE